MELEPERDAKGKGRDETSLAHETIKEEGIDHLAGLSAGRPSPVPVLETTPPSPTPTMKQAPSSPAKPVVLVSPPPSSVVFKAESSPVKPTLPASSLMMSPGTSPSKKRSPEEILANREKALKIVSDRPPAGEECERS